MLISPAWKRDEVEHALALTNPSHAVGDHPVLVGTDADAASRRADLAGEAVFGSPPPDADAVLAFSSGTTGLPKAVRHTHASLHAAVTALA